VIERQVLYAHNYTDHLGNVRLSYGLDPEEQGQLKILAENHYYPYGLKHSNYYAIEYAYKENELGTYVVLDPTQRSDYRYKYNGMEFQDELGLNLYDMDFRDYDPAIARWTGIDPVTHHNMSPYMAFDGNPVFWADPSGADSTDGNTLDIFGRDRFDTSGMYIPFGERGVGSFDEYLSQDGGGDSYSKTDPKDIAAALSLMVTAKLYFDDKDVSKLFEAEKQEIFKSNALETIGILLWEFATGTGMENRSFTYGEHPFANEYLIGRLNEIVYKFNDKLNAEGYKVRPSSTAYYDISLPFSPSSKPQSWGESIAKHLTSNKVQFFIGGAIVKVRLQNGILEGQVKNATSRNSLFLHLTENYHRKNGTQPLSTIYQFINFAFKLNDN
jgi:RHS repeat-associated protein